MIWGALQARDGELAALERGGREGAAGWMAGGAVYMLGLALHTGLGR